MKIKLEELTHQKEAIEAIKSAFTGIDESTNNPDKNFTYANPIIKYSRNEKANIDIKMETGTGKTFVYTQLMYELHKYGIFKFIIVVPTPSIKEGTKNFITSDYARQYFSGIPGYENTSLNLHVINAGDFSEKRGRKYFPVELASFLESTRENPNQVEVLLINSGMLTSSSMTRNDYEQTLFGSISQPMEAIAKTRPVVIIDEPHRFSRENKAYKALQLFEPQLIARFGATFPEIKEGEGKTKIDYFRGEPQYELNAIDSFNQDLVKDVKVIYPDITPAESENLYKIKDLNKNKLVVVNEGSGKSYEIETGENLSDIDEDFAGDITYIGIKQGQGMLSNEVELGVGMKLIPGTFSTNYQDGIISKAIDEHFSIEQKNFFRNKNSNINEPKIKTLSLFFIDTIRSFRGENQTKGWLAQHFEKMLTNKLTELIKKYEMPINSKEKEYREFLEATLKDLKADNQQVYAGYFSEDRQLKGDEAIQAEVEDILKNKEKLLSFKDEKGNWITRRFLFSKWTLREGWDNPNVFVIAKLRSSGSEISKIQEVGRGLRLPVDENGHRVTQDEFRSQLSYLIGHDEDEFVKKLTGDINKDRPFSDEKLTDEMIVIALNEERKTNPDFTKNDLLEKLDAAGIINRSNEFVDEVNNQKISGYQAFCNEYPEINQKNNLNPNKIKTDDSKETGKVKLKKENWNELKGLWKSLSKRQMIKFKDINKDAQNIARDIFVDADRKIFVHQHTEFNSFTIKIENNLAEGIGSKEENDSKFIKMPYGKFLKQIVLKTKLPVEFVHEQMKAAMKRLNNDTRYINEKTLNNIVEKFEVRFNKKVLDAELYSYKTLEFTGNTSIYNEKTNEFVDEISENEIGIYEVNSNEDNRYLYDRPPIRYDSNNPELDLLKYEYDDKIQVYGKLPRRSIKIPRVDTKGSTTPDFVYKINAGKKNKYLFVETKAKNKRLDDEKIVKIQKKYFEDFSVGDVYYTLAEKKDDVLNELRKLEKEND